jgi:predicted N-acyltransferase
VNTNQTFKIYNTTQSLPSHWDALAVNNIFLTRNYLRILETSAPENMTCHFIGLYQKEELVGIAVSQFINLNAIRSFGARDHCLKTKIRNFVFKNFCSHVLFIGNNMLTGQNAFYFDPKLSPKEGLLLLAKAGDLLRQQFAEKKLKVHLTAYKDFYESEADYFKTKEFRSYLKFSTQPNMVLAIPENWGSMEDYVGDLNKKYRDQYKRARKKAIGITKRKLSLEEIRFHSSTIVKLYRNVAENAPFNTFYLPEDHFEVFKEILNEKFLFYGYFIDNQLIGFNTLIKNGLDFDTYFLGYDPQFQQEKMLYLNMLYDMIGYSIKKKFKRIMLARTALEIKSGVGAKPIKMFGFIKHHNPLINAFIARFFGYLEPETHWQERHPFK